MAAGCTRGGDRPSREDARRCLEGAGLHVVGGEPERSDTDAPDAELIANDVRRGRHGTITLWVRGRESDIGERARDCLL